ncbi:MAG TPA: hypothetical protein VEI74_12100 [Candidatus Methylomirabilis sp.]|nr:hypothetical protein [Candidatus Methylomirabilis sp.]
MFTNKARLLKETQAVIDARISELMTKPYDQIRSLLTSPENRKVKVLDKSLDFGVWAQEHNSDRIAVIVEARRNFILGVSKVVANGFYKSRDGTAIPFELKDLWSHGY